MQMLQWCVTHEKEFNALQTIIMIGVVALLIISLLVFAIWTVADDINERKRRQKHDS